MTTVSVCCDKENDSQEPVQKLLQILQNFQEAASLLLQAICGHLPGSCCKLHVHHLPMCQPAPAPENDGFSFDFQISFEYLSLVVSTPEMYREGDAGKSGSGFPSTEMIEGGGHEATLKTHHQHAAVSPGSRTELDHKAGAQAVVSD